MIGTCELSLVGAGAAPLEVGSLIGTLGGSLAGAAPINSWKASPGFPMTAKIESTSNLSPAFAPIKRIEPERGLSKSIVALSLLISAKRSPFSTLSPTFLCQATISPSIIESLKRGILITSAIFFYFGN